MKSEPLWQVCVVTSPEAEEAVCALLEYLVHQTASVYTDEETKETFASIYVEKQTGWPASKRAALVAGLKEIQNYGLPLGPGKITIRKVRRADWAESWKRHFKPLEIGQALLIKPSWSSRRPRKNQAVVVLDPGLSFGTGQHATTLFCLRQLAECRQTGQRQSFLDMGTGSGILAIAAARLGYHPVRAFDFDPQSVRVARANAISNKVQNEISITRRDLSRLPPKDARTYHVVCANLTADLLLGERQRIVNRLRNDGTLVLAGILTTQFGRVQQAYEQSGLKLAVSRAENEWRSGAFVFKG